MYVCNFAQVIAQSRVIAHPPTLVQFIVKNSWARDFGVMTFERYIPMLLLPDYKPARPSSCGDGALLGWGRFCGLRAGRISIDFFGGQSQTNLSRLRTGIPKCHKDSSGHRIIISN